MSNGTVHRLRLIDGPPISCRPRRLKPELMPVAREQIDELIKGGIIEPSSGCWSSPIHFVAKKDGTWRMVGDYTKLNSRTIIDKYPVPNVSDFNHALAGARCFSVIDCKRAYHQIPMAPEDIEKTAITTPFGLFQYRFMPFGLRNAAQTWQRFINEVLFHLDFCFVYLDDILIFSPTVEKNKEHLQIVKDTLVAAGVELNNKKLQLHKPSVLFLGYVVSAEGLTPPVDKVKPVLELPRPDTYKELRRFLGTVNYYRKHLPAAAEVQAPLTDALAGQNTTGIRQVPWTPVMETAFEKLKHLLANAVTVAHPHPDATLFITTDASDCAIGAVLSQSVGDVTSPLQFFSKKLNNAQKKYSAFDRELLAVYEAVKHFRTEVEGRGFYILTDHKPLVAAIQKPPSDPPPRRFRHLDYILQFTSDVRYIKGADNIVADFLSRVGAVTSVLDLSDLPQRQSADPNIMQLINDHDSSLKPVKTTFPGVTGEVWCDESTGSLRPFIPKDLQRQVFDKLHSLAHPGVRASTRLVTERFVWRDMRRDCQVWARSCIPCQQNKVSRHTTPPLGTFSQPHKRFQHLHIDLVGPLTPSEGFRYVLSIIDRTTRWFEATPLPNITSETVARAFIDTWIARFGCPAVLTTDQGRQFESALFSDICRLCGISKIHTTAYHPQSNGLVERWHRTLKTALRCHGPLWTEALPFVLLGLRTTFKEDLKGSVAEFVYGQPLVLPGELVAPTPVASPSELPSLVERVKLHCSKLHPQPPAHHTPPRTYVPVALSSCTYVFLRDDTIKAPLQPPYTGPHKVLRRAANTMDILLHGSKTTVSLNRVKPALVEPASDDSPTPSPPPSSNDSGNRSHSSSQPLTHSSNNYLSGGPQHSSQPSDPHPFRGFSPRMTPSSQNFTLSTPSSCTSSLRPSSGKKLCPHRSSTPVSPGRLPATTTPTTPASDASPSLCRGFATPTCRSTPPSTATEVEFKTRVDPDHICNLSVLVQGVSVFIMLACDDKSDQEGGVVQRVVRRITASHLASAGNLRAFVRPNGTVIVRFPADHRGPPQQSTRFGRRLRPPSTLKDFETTVPGFAPRSPTNRPLPEDAQELPVTFLHPLPAV